MSKSSKASSEVIKDDTKTAVDDSQYQRYLDTARGICRAMEAESLVGIWDLGEIVREFTERKASGMMAGRDLEQFAADLGIDKGVSTLYFARKLNEKYLREKLPEMAKIGFGITHCKICFALDAETLVKVEHQLMKPDGKLVTARELQKIVDVEAHTSVQTAIESTPSPRQSRLQMEEEEASAAEELPPENTTEAPPVQPEKPDDGKTGSRGATPMKEFSHSPLQAFKKVESAATKLIAVAGDAIISATEVVKVGFDHPKAKDNARTALASAHGAIRDLLKLLPDLEARLKEALEDVSG